MTGAESGAERIVIVIVPTAVPIEVDTETETAVVPATVGTPVICRLELLNVSPGGSEDVTLEEKGVPVALSW